MEAAEAIRKALADDHIGGFEGLIDTIGGIFGLSEGYKNRMERTADEFQCKAQGLAVSIKALISELDEIDKDSGSIREQIEAVEDRQHELAATGKVFVRSGSMVPEHINRKIS
jgi:hypothetical protein